MNYFTQKPKENCGFIYKYTNKINGKSYIGQTVRSLSDRMGSNYHGYIMCTAFYNALKKYTLENFDIEILEECKIERLNEEEEKYITLFNSLAPNGYNLKQKAGGTHDTISRDTPVYKYDLDGNFIESYNSVNEAAKSNNTQYQSISAVLNGKRKQHNGFIYTYQKQEVTPVTVQKTHGRKTGQFDLDGNFIAEYDSANQAAVAIGKDSSAGRNIRSVCAGVRQTAYGFKWKYLD